MHEWVVEDHGFYKCRRCCVRHDFEGGTPDPDLLIAGAEFDQDQDLTCDDVIRIEIREPVEELRRTLLRRGIDSPDVRHAICAVLTDSD
jgi:hypothetical protein